MSFWNSPLIKQLEEGNLPTVDVQAKIDNESLVKLGIVITLAAVLVVAFSVLVKRL